MILAYIDPGLGALIWQAAVAALVGLLFYVKKIGKAIRGCVQKVLERAPRSDRG